MNWIALFWLSYLALLALLGNWLFGTGAASLPPASDGPARPRQRSPASSPAASPAALAPLKPSPM